MLRPRLSLSRLSDAIPQDHKDHCALFFCFSSQIFFGPAGRCYQLAVRLIIPHLTHLPVLIKSALLCVPRRSRHRSSNLPTSQHPLSCTSSFAILDLTMDVDRGLFGCQAKRRSVKICCQCCNLFIYFFSAFCCCCRCLVEHKNVHTSQHINVGSPSGAGGEGGLSGRGGGGAEGRVLGQRVHIVYFTHLLGRGRYCAVFLIPSWLSSSSRLLHFFSSSVSIPSSVQRGSLHCAPSSQLRHWKKNVVNHNID